MCSPADGMGMGCHAGSAAFDEIESFEINIELHDPECTVNRDGQG